MTTIELEARKAMLVKEILTDINSEEMLDKLAGYLKRLKKRLPDHRPLPVNIPVMRWRLFCSNEKKTPMFTHTNR